MSRGRSRFALRSGWLLLCAAALEAAAGSAAERRSLDLAVSPWAFPNRPVTITLEQKGVLAGRRVAVYLFVDQDQVARIPTRGDHTRVSVPMPPLAPGRHLLMAKVGTEVVEKEFRVLSWFWLAGLASALLALIAYGLARTRRRPDPTRA